MEKQINKLFWSSVLFTLAIKIFLAAAIPITSDEAYFIVWARHPDFGYYDHPPMIGWILYLVLFLGSSEFLVRLPAILSTILIGIGIYLILRDYDRVKAGLAAILFMVSPINILNVLVTTDTPLIIFSFLSAAFLYRALRDKKYPYYVLAGICLGMAFLSKYFAVLLGLSYLAYFVFSGKEKEKTIGFLLLFSAVLPFVAVNLYWNYTHCWANIMFNVFNRNKKEEFSLVKFIIFTVSQLYLITPPVVFYLMRKRKTLFSGLMVDRRFVIFVFAFLTPLLLFILLSFKKVVGLHWALAFYPFMYILLCFFLTELEFLKSIKFMMIFSLIHLFIIGSVLSIPLKYLKNNKNYRIIVLGTKPQEITKYLKPYEGDFIFATPSYANSAVISYHYGKDFLVFSAGSHHGRQDDILTDFRKLEGKNILVLEVSKPEDNEYSAFFDNVEIKEITVRDAQFYLVLGRGFRYEVYKEKVLSPVKERYYNIPAYLPMSSCYFCDRYFR